ncbi:helix-turn-helix domain-containing protein [Enterococcus gilvus]|uniref:helix-turn-helix domain-containing protein n=1 Tax=Enterococcus gilvus TaxID=160453 RepID=UPI0028D373D3|nr:helix-turn-helix domain-containing protein [Enterococcus gilvus]
MRKFQFLEKYDFIQYEILDFLFNKGGKSTKKTLITRFNLSRQTLRSRLVELKEFSKANGNKFEIIDTRNQVEFVLMPHVSMSSIFNDYAKKSLKIKLLLEIFKNGEFKTLGICYKLNISESSLFRKIKEINEELEKFNLSIKNGRLMGKEIQIRFFYLQLFLFYDFMNTKVDNLQIYSPANKAVLDIEKSFGVVLSQYNKHKFFIYCSIIFNRLKNNRKSLLHFDHMETAPENILQKLQEILKCNLSAVSSKINKCEAMGVFILMTATQFMPIQSEWTIYTMNHNKECRTLIDRMGNLFYEKVKEIFPVQEQKYKICANAQQIHYHSLFLSGSVYIDRQFSESESVDKKILDDFDKSLIQELITSQKEMAVDYHIDELFMDRMYGMLIELIKSEIYKKIKAGVYLEDEYFLGQNFGSQFIKNITNKCNNQLVCMKYDSNEEYDLIVTNISPLYLKREIDTPVYVISNYNNKYDFEAIKNLSQTIFHDKYDSA